MTARMLLVVFVVASLARSAHAQDPAAAKAAGASAAPHAPAKTAAPAPSSAEVAKAIDAMASSCGKALELQTEIQAASDRRKAAQTARTKSNAEVKKKLRAVTAAEKRVALASKRPGTNAAELAGAAKADYEAALAESKTVEVETQNMQAAEDQLVKLVDEAQQASESCAKYEEAIRLAAAHAKKAVADARRHAQKARAMAAMRAAKALEAARAQQTKELAALKSGTESARTSFEALKAEAAKQPPPAEKPAPAARAAAAHEKKAAGDEPGKAHDEKPGKAADAHKTK